MEWLNTISRAWKIKELRSKMIFTPVYHGIHHR